MLAVQSRTSACSSNAEGSSSQYFSLKNNNMPNAHTINSNNQIFNSGGDIYIYQRSDSPSLTLQKISSWLRYKVVYKATHDSAFISRTPGTGGWFLKSDEYCEWVNGNKIANLECVGMPGAGKTTLVSAVVEDLLQRYSFNASQNLVLYVYFRYDEQEVQSPEIVYANLLSQVIEAKNVVADSIKALYDEYSSHGIPPRLDKIKMLLKAEISTYDKVFLVIDALDEYSVRDYELALELISDLQRLGMKILATSRNHIPFYPGSFSQLPVRANEDDVRALIMEYLTTRRLLSTLVGRSPDLQEQIIKRLCANMNGMFIIVRLHIEWIASRPTRNAVIDALKQLPTTLDEMFELTMNRVRSQGEDKVRIAIEVIFWVLFANRPLRPVELQHVISFSNDMQTIDEGDIWEIDDVLALCAGLVVVVVKHKGQEDLDQEEDQPQEQVCQFVHFSAKEFFDRNWKKYFPDAHRQITEKCLCYATVTVNQTLHRYPAWLADTYRDAVKFARAAFPLSTYATTYWGSHAYSAKEHFNFQLVSNFYNQGWLSVYVAKNGFGMSIANDMSQHSYILLYLARYGLISLFRLHWASGGQSTNRLICDAEGWQPIHLAACFGHLPIVSHLVDHGVDVTAKTHRYSQTPLHYASNHNHPSIVELLLKNGVCPNVQDKRGSTPLHVAASSNHCSVIQLLLSNGADPNAQNQEGLTPLQLPASKGHHSVVQLLLENGANPNIQDKSSWAPLQRAASSGHHSVVQLLLSHGVDPNTQDGEGWAPIHLAACKGHYSVVQLLLETGAHSNTKNTEGSTPLHGATGMDYQSVVQLLLDNAADPNVQDKSGSTPIWLAIAAGRHSLVQLLLDNGADLNVQDMFGRTPLQRAASDGYNSFVQLLLESGADPSIQDRIGRTPLHYAVSGVHQSVAQTLLANGVHPDVQDKDGQTPLHYAASSGYNSIIQLLLCQLADPNIQDKAGESALHSYLRSFLEEHDAAIVRIMLEKGANPLLQDRQGRTPLFYALQLRSPEAGRTLEAAEGNWKMAHCVPSFQLLQDKASNREIIGSKNSSKNGPVDLPEASMVSAREHKREAEEPLLRRSLTSNQIEFTRLESRLELIAAQLQKVRVSFATLAGDVSRRNETLASTSLMYEELKRSALSLE